MRKLCLFLVTLCAWPFASCAQYASPQTAPPTVTSIMSSEDKKPKDKDFIGIPIKKAQELASKHKIRHRVISIDGKYLPVTRDYRPERLNFSVEKGVVTKVRKG